MDRSSSADGAPQAGPPSSLELSFRPTIDQISTARRFVAEFYERALGDADLTSRVAMTTHELLENALKYSCDGGARVRIEVKDEAGGGRIIRIETRNRLPVERQRDLRARFDEMARYPDAFEYYQVLIRRSTGETSGSGLGLARVRAEGEMIMSCDFDADEVCIRAITRLPGEERHG